MREIKFRAWDKRGKEMYVVRELSFNEKGLVIEANTGILKDTILMQYTGLLDKNGAEIYEDDIVIQVGVKQDGKTRLVRKARVVEWVYTKSNAGFNIAPSPESYADRTMLRTEIIGNIYENPDLIK